MPDLKHHHHFERLRGQRPGYVFAPRDSDGFGRGGRGGGGGRSGGGRGGRSGRVFGHGGLRVLLLSLIAEKPRHGYDLIKEIEERLHGAYSPSPGVIYPTLAMLEDQGLAVVESDEGGRKLYAATDAGRAWLTANAEAVEAVTSRMASAERPHRRPPQIERAVENLRMAIRFKLAGAPLSDEQANAIAAILDAAAQNVERS